MHVITAAIMAVRRVTAVTYKSGCGALDSRLHEGMSESVFSR